MLAEAGEPPLEYRRKQTSVSYITNLVKYPNNFRAQSKKRLKKIFRALHLTLPLFNTYTKTTFHPGHIKNISFIYPKSNTIRLCINKNYRE